MYKYVAALDSKIPPNVTNDRDSSSYISLSMRFVNRATRTRYTRFRMIETPNPDDSDPDDRLMISDDLPFMDIKGW
jgi:hypothetical protein